MTPHPLPCTASQHTLLLRTPSFTCLPPRVCALRPLTATNATHCWLLHALLLLPLAVICATALAAAYPTCCLLLLPLSCVLLLLLLLPLSCVLLLLLLLPLSCVLLLLLLLPQVRALSEQLELSQERAGRAEASARQYQASARQAETVVLEMTRLGQDNDVLAGRLKQMEGDLRYEGVHVGGHVGGGQWLSGEGGRCLGAGAGRKGWMGCSRACWR